MTSLAKLIDIIDTRAGEIEIAFGEPTEPKGIIARVNDRENAYRNLMADLAREHRANHRAGDPHILTLAGIKASCTSGIAGLMTAWLRKARKQLEQEKENAA
jgi:hypothetical protein